MEDKFLPIGTVVMLNGGTKRVMITGFCSMAAEDNSTMYDYSGCMFPEGFLSSDETALFNHEQIAKVYHMGLVDEEEKNFKAQLTKFLNSANSSNINNAQNNNLDGTSSIQKNVANLDNKEISEEWKSIPPIGPGLPGYNVPTNQVSVEKPSASNNGISEDWKSVPPIGPGLPGYNSQITNNSTVEMKLDGKLDFE